MNKKNKSILIVSLIIIGILAIGILAKNGLPFAIGSSSSGLTIQGISSSSVISKNTDLNGVWFLINAITSGGQSIVGDLIDGADFKSESGYQTQYPLQITAEGLNEVIDYRIVNQGQPINTFSLSIVESSATCDNSKTFTHPNAGSCPSGTTYIIPIKAGGNFGLTYTCRNYCITSSQTGVYAEIEPSSAKGNVKITLNARGESISQIIGLGLDSSGNQIANPSANFISNNYGLIATVQDLGKLWTGNYPPTKGFLAYYDFGNSNWAVTSSGKFTSWQNSFTDATSLVNSAQYTSNKIEYWSCPAGYTSAQCSFYVGNKKYSNLAQFDAELNQKIDSVNSIIRDMKDDTFNIAGTGTSQSVINPSDKNNALLRVNLPFYLSQTQLVFKVKAKWLGVKISSGIPSISSATCPDFRSGDNGKINLVIKNIGDDTGNFVPSVICPNVRQSYNMQSFTLDAGQSKTITIPIDANAIGTELSDNCKIHLQDFNDPASYADSSVTCKILKPATCTNDVIEVIGLCIKKCVDGTKTNLKCCASDEKAVFNEANYSNGFGGYSCVKSGTCPSGTTLCSDGSCKAECNDGSCTGHWYYLYLDGLWCKLLQLLTIVKWIVLVVGSLFSFLFGKQLLEKIIKKKDQTNKIIIWAVSILLGVAVGIVLYSVLMTSLFYIIIFGVILFNIVIKLIIPRI